MMDGSTVSSPHNDQHTTGGLPPNSPKTGAEMDPAQAIVVQYHMARTLVLQFKEDKTREWEALRRAWHVA